MHDKFKETAALSGLFLILTGCAAPRMVAPLDIANGSKILEVQNRSRASGMFADESFDLGSYKVSKVDRSMTRRSALKIDEYSASKTTNGYSYELSSGETKWSGSCSALRKEKSMDFAGGRLGNSKANLACECAAGIKTGILELNSDFDESKGKIVIGANTFTVAAVEKTDKNTVGMGPVGYRFDGTAGPMGAVEILHPGRVWLTDKLSAEEREPAACLMAGMILYKEPEIKSH